MPSVATIWQAQLNNEKPLYALVEISAHPDLAFFIDTYPNEPLFIEQALENDTPRLYPIVRTGINSDLLPALLEAGLAKNALLFIHSHLDIKSLVRQLRRYAKARDKDDEVYWLRFWDARVLPGFIQNLNADEYRHFFWGIEQFMVEDYRKPENICVFDSTLAPEPQKIDKNNTWDGQGYMLLRPELQQSLIDSYEDYLRYVLTKKLMQEYPHENMPDFDTVNDWVVQQNDYCHQFGITIWKTAENLITSAWILGEEHIKALREKIVLDTIVQKLSVDIQSEEVLRMVLDKTIVLKKSA